MIRAMHRIFALAAALSFFAAAMPASAADAKKKVVFIAGGPSHGFLAHDHLAGCRLLSKRIADLPGFDSIVYYKDWPKPEAFEGASAVVIYADGGNGHMALGHLKELQELSDKGVGVGCIHYAVEPGDEKNPKGGRPEFLSLIGGYYETFYSVNPDWKGVYDHFPKHPATNGVKPFATDDEWYYHMRFRDNMEGVTPILSAVPPDSTRREGNDAHGANPSVRADLGKKKSEVTLWVSENKGRSRGFGCTGGHYHRNWAQDQFRKTVLNSIVWIAKGEVPADGIESKRPDVEELLSDRDPGDKGEQVPANFDRAKLAKEIEEINKPLEPKQARKPAADGELLFSAVAERN